MSNSFSANFPTGELMDLPRFSGEALAHLAVVFFELSRACEVEGRMAPRRAGSRLRPIQRASVDRPIPRSLAISRCVRPLVCTRRTASSANSFVNRRCCVIEFLLLIGNSPLFRSKSTGTKSPKSKWRFTKVGEPWFRWAIAACRRQGAQSPSTSQVEFSGKGRWGLRSGLEEPQKDGRPMHNMEKA